MESPAVTNPENSPPTESAARQGKVARLPHSIREELNRRIQNGEEGKTLAAWLNSLPETQAILEAHFDGKPVSEMNLSRWRVGGYRDWDKKQEALELAHTFCADGSELAAAPSLTENLAFRAAAQIAMILRDFNPSGDQDRQLESLALLCREIYRLRRGDQDAKRLQIECERLALQHQKFQEQSARANKAPHEELAPVTSDDFRLIEQRDNL
jgi:hypothetical protein